MTVIASSLPSLRSLALSGIDKAVPGWPEIQLQPLSQLTGLTDLSIATHRAFAAATLASLSMVKHLASLEIQLGDVDGVFQHVIPHLSSLWSLSHLTHLSCIRVDMAPPHIGGAQGNLHGVTVTVPAFEFGAIGKMITTLSGCRQLTSLQLPWAIFGGSAAERLATELPLLTQLTANSILPSAPMPSCSWKELTLCGKSPQILSRHELFHLPFEGLDRLHVTRLVLPPFCSLGDADIFVSMMERHGPLLASKLQAAANNDTSGVHLSFGYKLRSALDLLPRIIASLAALDGIVDSLRFDIGSRLRGSHVQALATALPRLAHFSVCEPGLIDDNAWASVGTLPSLKTFSTMRDSSDFIQPQHALEPFQPRHMALLASSVTRPLTVTVAQSDAEVAAAALKALQAEGHVGATFITLHQREA